MLHTYSIIGLFGSRRIFLNDKWSSVNKEAAWRKILKCSNKDQVRNLGTYFDKIRYKSKSDVWLTVHRNSVWIRKTN